MENPMIFHSFFSSTWHGNSAVFPKAGPHISTVGGIPTLCTELLSRRTPQDHSGCGDRRLRGHIGAAARAGTCRVGTMVPGGC